MGVQVQLTYNEWITRFPEFRDNISELQAEALFVEASVYHINDGSGPVRDPAAQKVLLGLVTAHLAASYYGTGGEGASGMVGQITSASQGSASLSVQPLAATGTQAY